MSQQEVYTDASVSSSPILEAAVTTEDPTLPFVTAQDTSFFIGESDGDTSAERSISRNTECQSKEDLAGSYCYGATGAMPPAGHHQLQAQHIGGTVTCGINHLVPLLFLK